MLSQCTYNSHLLLPKFHVINLSILFDGTTHVPEAMVIVGESLELAMDIESGDLSCHSCDNYWIPHPHSISL